MSAAVHDRNGVASAAPLRTPSLTARQRDLVAAALASPPPSAAQLAHGRALTATARRCLRRRDFPAAWAALAEGDRLHRSDDYGRAFLPGEWDGSPLNGRSILVRAGLFEHDGFGDVILFARYLPRLRAAGAGRILVHCREPLGRLLDGASLADDVVICVPHDPLFQVPMHANVSTTLYALPHLLGGLDEQSAGVPYLRPPALAPSLPDQRADAMLVGLVWSARAGRGAHLDRRAIPCAAFGPLATVPGVQLDSLQVGEHAAHLAEAPFRDQVLDLAPRIADFADTAALIARLDLIVTVDTAVANLAGAMGRPVWVLLPSPSPCWRWGDRGTATRWYPTARLFRQRTAGAWAPVIDGVRAALELLATRYSPAEARTGLCRPAPIGA